MGFRDLKDAITGKAAADKKQAREAHETLQKKLEALLAEKKQLESEIDALTKAKEETEKAGVKAAEESYKRGRYEGEVETKEALSLEGWRMKNKFQDLPKQEQMAKFLSHLVRDEIMPQDEKEALLTLQDLMKSNSVDVMRPEDSYERECLLEKFLQGFYDKRLSRSDEAFFQKVFKVILNAKDKKGPKVNITTHLPHGRYPLVGYFGANKALHPFLETAIKSPAFNPKEFDGDHFFGVFRPEGLGNGEYMAAHKLLIQNGVRDPNVFDDNEYHRDLFLKAFGELVDEGKINDSPKKMSDQLQQRLNKMSPRELLKAVKEGIISGEIKVEETAAPKPAPKKKVTRKVRSGGARE